MKRRLIYSICPVVIEWEWYQPLIREHLDGNVVNVGRRPVDLCAWESFGKVDKDAIDQLKLTDFSLFEANYDDLPPLASTNSENDIVLLEWYHLRSKST